MYAKDSRKLNAFNKLNVFGQVSKITNKGILREIMKWKPSGERKQGCHRPTRGRTIVRDPKERGLSWTDAEEIILD